MVFFSSSGTWAFDSEGREHTVYPRGCYVISDGPERHLVALVKSGYCIVCRVPYKYLDSASSLRVSMDLKKSTFPSLFVYLDE